MKNNIRNEIPDAETRPLNPPKGDFGTVQVWQHAATERLVYPLSASWRKVGRGRFDFK